MKIAIMGAGRVGSLIARDLKERFICEILVGDLSFSNLDKLDENHKFIKKNINFENLYDGTDSVNFFVRGADLVINALPGRLGYSVRKIL